MRSGIALMVSLLVLLSCATQPKDGIVPAALEGEPAAGPAVKVAAAKDCSDDSFCTREYLPTTCQFNGQSFDGSNPCEAKKLVRRYACEKDLKWTDADVACKSKDEGAADALPQKAPAKKGKSK